MRQLGWRQPLRNVCNAIAETANLENKGLPDLLFPLQHNMRNTP